MAGANYLGGGVVNTGKPAEHYRTIDQRKNSASRPGSVTDSKINNAKIFDKSVKSNLVKRLESSRPTMNLGAKKNVNAKRPTMKLDAKKNVNVNSVKSEKQKLGTDIALKTLSKEMETQLYGMFWNMIDSARDTDPEGGFAEKMFRGPYLSEVVKGGSDEKLGDIGQAIYNELSGDKLLEKPQKGRDEK